MVEEVKTYLGKNEQKKIKAVLNLESHSKIVSMQGLLEKGGHAKHQTQAQFRLFYYIL